MEIISLQDYLMNRDKLYPDEFTDEYSNNAINLLNKVNQLLVELGYTTAIVTSGWRSKKINELAGGGAHSAHLEAKAIDIEDDSNQTLGNKLKDDLTLLEKYDLYMEDLGHTKGSRTNWVHLQIRPASMRIFIP